MTMAATSVRVVALKGTQPVGAWEFEKSSVTVGRSKTADVRLDDPAVSRVHCVIEARPDGVFVRDNGSRNGIKVNGKRVEEAALSSRDEVSIERFRLKAYLIFGGATVSRVRGKSSKRSVPVAPQATPSRERSATAPAARKTHPPAEPPDGEGEWDEIFDGIRRPRKS